MSDYETAQRRRNFIVGIFVLVAAFALIWLVAKFGDLPGKLSEIGSFQVFVQFPTAPGVQKDTTVMFCGYQIGRVTKVSPPEIREEILPDGKRGSKYYQTLVVMSIDKKFISIPYDSKVTLMTRGLGSSYIKIVAPIPDPNEEVTDFLKDGSVVQGVKGTSSEFFPAETKMKLEKLVDSLTKLSENTNDIIGDPNNKENVKITLANLANASGQATKTLEEFHTFAASGVALSEDITKSVAKIQAIIDKVNEGDGTAAKFINDGRLYEGMLDDLDQLQLLLQDIKSFIAESREKGIKIKL